MRAIGKAKEFIDDRQLPLPRHDYLEMVEMCLRFNVLMFEEHEYAQQYGLAMGSPLSPAAACLFMELLEEEKFKNIMGEETTWIRYVDDVLIVTASDMDIAPKLQSLNTVEPRIQFSIENETAGRLPLLDTLITRDGQNVKFQVHRKPTSKEDYIHFYSGHHLKYKRGGGG